MICSCMVSRSIGHLCHILRFIYRVYLSLWVFVSFLWVFHSLGDFCYAFGVSRVHMRVLWDPMLLGSCLIYTRYERWVIFLLGSPDHCLTHHSIIGDMTFLYCANIGWSSLLPLSHCFLLYHITSFQIFVPPFYPFPTYWYIFFIWYLLHIMHMFHWWFDHSSFSYFAIDISFGYL